MPEVKITINVNKAAVMADLAEIKAELNELEATIDCICKKANQLTDTLTETYMNYLTGEKKTKTYHFEEREKTVNNKSK